MVVQTLSCVQLFVTPWTAVCRASLSFTISQSWLKFMSIESVMPSNHLILFHLLLLPSVLPSLTGSFSISWLFASGGQSIGATASASVLPMNIQGWFPLGLTGLIYLQSKSLLQDHNLKASVLWCSAFFMVQVSHPCMTAGKTIALTYCLGLNLSELALTPHLPLKNIWKFLPPCLCLTFPLWVNSHIYYM